MSPNLKINLQYASILNSAMQQNHVPPIRELEIEHKGDTSVGPIKIELENNLGIWQSWVWKLDGIEAQSIFKHTDFYLPLEWETFAGLTERQDGKITLTISLQATNEIIHTQQFPLSLLPYDHWQGVAVLPELLASFVTPNLPAVQEILHQSARLLGNWTGDPSLNEYQSQDPDRVRKQMAAIFEVIRSKNIIYASVPASFEQHGQRVRMPDAVIQQNMGNCLDMSLLYVSCLEAAGLNPLVVIIKGHAFAGAWLVNDTFADAACDDPSLLTKRMAAGIHDLALIEATAMNAGKNVSFEAAEMAAAAHFENPDNFILFIDVKRARYGGVRPLPIRIQAADGWKWLPTEMPGTELEKAEKPDDIKVGQRLGFKEHIDIGRQQIWERKLLDLTLRNNLLNMRITQYTLQLLTRQLSELEDMLATGMEMQVLPRPADWDGNERSAGLYESLYANDPINQLVIHELKNKRIRCYLPELGFNEHLLTMYRKAKMAMEENGANTLFLAIGVLRWYENETSQKPRFAPLILMPVEIIRRGSQKGFVIRSRDEETRFNITLLEMLRQDFGIQVTGLEPLPRDENGIDVKAVLNIIRQLVMNQPRWDVEDKALIGHFSFSKFVMWRDIHEHAHLLSRNEVVNSLLNNRLTWTPREPSPAEQQPDDHWKVSDILLPISADISQLRAIGAALNGESYVLHGPPGTGKSQTITNIIANALNRGKRVLFVAEKMAALEVVERRLEDIDLGPFCLELHSNKARKSEVLKQLKAVIESERKIPPAAFDMEAERIGKLRSELNDYVKALHQKGHFGLSLFDHISHFSSFDDSLPEVPLSREFLQQAGTRSLTDIEDWAGQFNAATNACGQVFNHPLALVHWDQYNRADAQEVLASIERSLTLLNQIQLQENEILQSICFLDFKPVEKEHWHTIYQWINLWKQVPVFSVSLWKAEDPVNTWEQVSALAGVGIQRDQTRKKVLENFSEQSLSLPASEALDILREADQTWFLPRWFKRRKPLADLKKYALNDFDKTGVTDYYKEIELYQKLAEKITREEHFLAPLLGNYWKGGQAEWAETIAVTQVITRTYQYASQLLSDPGKLKTWRSALGDFLSEGISTYIEIHLHKWKAFSTSWIELSGHVEKIERILQVTKSDIPANESWTEYYVRLLQQWKNHSEQWRAWSQYRQLSGKALDLNVEGAVQALEKGLIPQSSFLQCLLKGIHKSCADDMIDHIPVLRDFSKDVYTEKMNRFQSLIQLFQDLSRKQIAANVSMRIPNMMMEAAKSSEVGILQKAISNGGRGISIRQLFQQIPNLLPRIAPCMLMSPISVAQYLSLDLEPFDLIIFDEASQMPTPEAIGAMARGKHVIVVGDPKQMPPTSFFSAQQFDEENAEKEDLESILDDCLALPMPSRYLLWHYRSRHESLIAFSNAKYYENKLLTFPSVDDIKTKVQWMHIEGFYDRSRARHNMAEGKAVVEEVLNRLRHTEHSKKSIGIVTFSSVQQKLIQDLLDEAFEKHPGLEIKATQSDEPLFIKNLENVQGDERDVILFSIGYGPDKEGKVYLNFGPINREGGWRRLNVAVSRARYEMKVFSTLRAAHIDLSRTASEGVAGLRAFLEYAEKGKYALPQSVGISGNLLGSFEMQLAEALRKKGHGIHTAVGTSGFKIDMAVVNPELPGEYLLAILCDGKPFEHIAAARDRFVGKMQVLRQLGWPVERVWATDWWNHPEKTILMLEESIQQAMESEHIADLFPKLSAPDILSESLIENEPINYNTLPPNSFPKYLPVVLPVVSSFSAVEFLWPQHEALIGSQLKKVIQGEAPIVRKLLYQRVLQAWSITRLGIRIQAALDNITEHLDADVKQINGQEIIAPKGFDWNVKLFRVPDDTNEKSRRDADVLPVTEVANAMHEILKQHFTLNAADLFRETSRIMGFARNGNNVETLMKASLKYGLDNEIIFEKGGILMINQ